MGIGRIVVTVMSGADDGKVFELDKSPIMLGRHPDDDVCLPYDNRVSRHHARMSREGDCCFIQDVGPEGKGSTNGTYIGEEKVIGKASLSSGNFILLGSVLLKFEVLN